MSSQGDLSFQKQLDRICDNFELAWDSVEPPRIEKIIGALAGEERVAVFEALLAVELELKQTGKRPVSREEYLRRFPEYSKEISIVFEDHRRRTPKLLPSLRTRCPHCRHAIEIVQDCFVDVPCPSCGGTFNLEGVDVTESYRSVVRKLGNFELVEQVGVGQFGVVWKAKDTELDRFVAIKIPRHEFTDGAAGESFIREARAAAQLRHSSIVSVHEIGREEDTFFIVSDFIQGANLKEWMSGHPIPAREAAKLCCQIAEALTHAHEQGVIHRDLKPANIMMDLDGNPHIMDFGLAKREGGEITITADGVILGTPAYMPPEQARGHGHAADCRSDVYSLGVVLFEMLTGEMPFRGEKRMLIVQILTEEVPRVRKLNSTVPPDVETICLKCLEKNPEQRYQSAHDLAEDLQHFVDGNPISARPIGPVNRAIRRWKARPLVPSLTAAFLFALLGGLGGTFTQWQRAEKSARLATSEATRALEKSALAAKEEAKAKRFLYESLVSESKTLNWSGTPGYRKFVWTKIKQALNLRRDDKLTLRNIAVGAMGDGLGYPPTSLGQFTQGIRAVTGRPSDACVAYTTTDRSLTIVNSDSGEIEARLDLPGVGEFVGFSDAGKSLAVLTRSSRTKGTVPQLLRWDRSRGSWTLGSETDLLANPVCGAASANRSLVACGYDDEQDCQIQVFDISLNKVDEQFRVKIPGSAGVVELSADGQFLAYARRGSTRIHLVDTTDRQELWAKRPDVGVVRDLAFGTATGLLACGGQEGLTLYSIQDQKEIYSVPSQFVAAVAFDPSGTLLAFSDSFQNTIRLWSSGTKRVLKSIVDTEEPDRIVFADGGRSLVASLRANRLDGPTGYSLKSWSLETPERISVGGHSRAVPAIAFTSDNSQLVSVGKDSVVQFFDVRRRTSVKRIGHESGQALSIDPRGRFLVSGDFDTGEIYVWEMKKYTRLHSLERLCGKGVNSIAFSSSGHLLAAAGEDGVQIWKLGADEQGHSFSPQAHLERVRSGFVQFSPTGDLLAWSEFLESDGSTHGKIHVWDLENETELIEIESEVFRPYQCLSFFPDGSRLVFINSRFAAEIWNLVDGKMLKCFDAFESGDFKGAVRTAHLALSPSGKLLAATSPRGNKVNLWNTETSTLEFTLPESSSTAWYVAWNSDGDRLAVSHENGEIAVWDISIINDELAKLELK